MKVPRWNELLILLGLLVLIPSCSKSAEKYSGGDEVQTVYVSTQDQFKDFVARFKGNQTFQMEALADSISILYWTGEFIEDENGSFYQAMEEVKIPKQDWQYDTMEEASTGEEFVCKGKECSVRIYGLDNGIDVTYSFTQTNENWQLVQVEDAST